MTRIRSLRIECVHFDTTSRYEHARVPAGPASARTLFWGLNPSEDIKRAKEPDEKSSPAPGRRKGCPGTPASSRMTRRSRPGTATSSGVLQQGRLAPPPDGAALRRVDYDSSSADSQNGNGRGDDPCIRVRLRPGEGGVEPDRVWEKTSKLEEKRQGYLRAQRRSPRTRIRCRFHPVVTWLRYPEDNGWRPLPDGQSGSA